MSNNESNIIEIYHADFKKSAAYTLANLDAGLCFPTAYVECRCQDGVIVYCYGNSLTQAMQVWAENYPQSEVINVGING